MSDMLPCPFCGGDAGIFENYDPNCFGYIKVTLIAECRICGAKPFLETVYGTIDRPDQFQEKIAFAKSEMKEKWNRRYKEGR